MNYKIQHRAFIIILLSVYAFSYAQNPTNAYGSADTIVKRFTYSAPHYYAAERTQMGYGVVETHEMHTNSNPHTVYRKQKRHYNNTDFLEHGKLIYGLLLTGAAGVSMGYYPIELLIGAHFNSLFFPSTNGYIPQLDSFDDQLSIMLGIQHAYKHQYMNLYNAK